MFNTDDELNTYFEKRNLQEDARALIRHLRETHPARAVETGPANSTGNFPSNKLRRGVEGESKDGEVAVLWLWEYDDSVYEVYNQLPQVKLSTLRPDGKPGGHRATIDFFLLAADYTGWVEVKSIDAINQKLAGGDRNYYQDDEGRWHYRPGEEHAAQYGLQYRLVIVEEINQTRVANNKMLADYWKPDQPEIPESAAAFIRSILADRKFIRLIELVRHEPPVNADHVYRMIATGALYVDLDRERLGEIERTIVYADRESARIHFVEAEVAVRGSPNWTITRCSLSAGARLTWDGRAWTIINVGDRHYSLQADDKRLAELEREKLEALVTSGAIVAATTCDSAQSKAASERLMRAGPNEVDAATARMIAIRPGPDDPAPTTPARTLRLWRQLYRQGEIEFGSGFIGLLPNYGQQGNRSRKVTDRTLKIIREEIDSEHERNPRSWPKTNKVLGTINLRLEGAFLPKVSAKTVKKEIERGFTAHQMMAKGAGARAAYAYKPMQWYVTVDTPRHGQRPFEVAHIDCTLADVQLVDERFGRKTRKAWSCSLLDAYPRTVLAAVNTFAPPSAAVAMAVIRICVQRHGRVPQTIIYDSGPEFQSASFKRLLLALEITGITRPKGSPRQGSVIERLFRRWNDDYIHGLTGNNVPLQSPRLMSASHDPRRNAIWTFEAFDRSFLQYLYEVYPNMLHQGLGVTPNEARDQGLRDFGERAQDRIVYNEALELLCNPEVNPLTVQKGGWVRRIGLAYQHDALNDPAMIGREVKVRIDAFNASRLFLYVNNQWVVAYAPIQATFARYTPAEVERASKAMGELSTWNSQLRHRNAETIAAFLGLVEARETQLIADKLARKAKSKEGLATLVQKVQELHDDFFCYLANGTAPEAANDAGTIEAQPTDAPLRPTTLAELMAQSMPQEARA